MRLTIHRAIYFVLLILLVAAQPVSNFMMSGMEILLAANWLLEWDMRRKFHVARQNGSLWFLVAFGVLLVVHLVWIIPSSNTAYAWHDLFKKLPLFAIPLVLLTSRPLSRRQLQVLFFVFVATVFVATVVGHVRFLSMPGIPYRDIVPFISHIRFSLNVCLAISLTLWFLYRRYFRRMRKTPWTEAGGLFSDWLSWLLLVVLVSFIAILIEIRSFTAFAILGVLAVVMLASFWRRINPPLLRWLSLSVVVVVCAVVVVVSFFMISSYYRPVPLRQQPLALATVNGNPYAHGSSGLVENGNLLDNYICEVELRTQWAKVSSVPFDALTPNGYGIFPTLTRYLNGLGTTKDSAGMTLLQPDDIAAIEQGIANPVYLHGSSLKQMYYVMLFEYENYRYRRCVPNFTMLERFELWRNAWRVFLQHPLLGVGTGDVVDVCHAQLKADHSPIADTEKNVHNQYITFLVTFGIIGCSLIAAAFVYAFRRCHYLRLAAMAAFVTIFLVSCLTEDTLGTLAGAVFSVLFPCLLSDFVIAGKTIDSDEN